MNLEWRLYGERSLAQFRFTVPRGTCVDTKRVGKDGDRHVYSRFVLDRERGGYAVDVEIDEKELIALAVRAMRNKGKVARDGALRIDARGFEPSVQCKEERR